MAYGKHDAISDVTVGYYHFKISTTENRHPDFNTQWKKHISCIMTKSLIEAQWRIYAEISYTPLVELMTCRCRVQGNIF